MVKKVGIVVSLILCCFFYVAAQDVDTTEKLTSQGAWFLFSIKTEEKVGEEVLTQVEFFKKDDISSIYFDKENKLYTVLSKYGKDVYEDRWKLVDDTHYVMVGPNDGSSQIVEILEINETKLVLRNCGDIESGTSCSLYTYLSTKDGWLPDSEVENLNITGIVKVDKMTP